MEVEAQWLRSFAAHTRAEISPAKRKRLGRRPTDAACERLFVKVRVARVPHVGMYVDDEGVGVDPDQVEVEERV